MNEETERVKYIMHYWSKIQLARDFEEVEKENSKLKETNEEHRKINGDLRKENQELQIYKKFIEVVIITPDNWNNKECKYELHNMSKQYLYKRLFELRHRIINNERK